MKNQRWISCTDSLQLIPAVFAMRFKEYRKKEDPDKCLGGRILIYQRNHQFTILLGIPESFLKHFTNEDIKALMAQLFAELIAFARGKGDNVFNVNAWWNERIHKMYKEKAKKEPL